MDIDLLIILGYFLTLLVVGIVSGRGVHDVKDFYTGGKGYSAIFIFATLSASFIGGGFTQGLAEKVFSMGLVFVVALWGFSLKEIIIATWIVPKLQPFEKAMSVGDIMGQLYGKPAKIISGFAGCLVCAGIAGAQLSALGFILNLLTGLSPSMGILIGIGIVMIYAAFGGMRAIVANDVIHFCVLIVALPIVLLTGLRHVGGISTLITSLPASHLSIFDSLPLLTVIGLMLNFFFGETLVPPYVQRLLIGQDLKETAKGTLWSGLLSIPFFLLVGCIGLIALVLNPALSPNLALPYVITQVMPVGLKGIAIAGMMAVILSSADSFLNAATVSLTHDVLKSTLSYKLPNLAELILSRFFTVVIGAVAALIALTIQSALDILLLAYNFWTPFILVPLVAGMVGVRAGKAAFWWGCVAGILTTALWMGTMGEATLNGAVVGIMMNALVFFAIKARKNA